MDDLIRTTIQEKRDAVVKAIELQGENLARKQAEVLHVQERLRTFQLELAQFDYWLAADLSPTRLAVVVERSA